MTKEHRAFLAQLYRAKQRNIEFKFTFEEWTKWWGAKLGPDWMGLRGCKKGQYCMARKGDKGPYQEDNVLCILATKNSEDKIKNGSVAKGSKHGGVKLTEKEVLSIYHEDEFPEIIAIKYGLEKTTVRMIKLKRLWQELLAKEHKVRIKIKRKFKRTLTAENVMLIFSSNESNTTLATKYGVTEGNIRAIRKSQAWVKVTQHLTSPP